MRKRVLDFLKRNPMILEKIYAVGGIGLKFLGLFIPIKDKTILFASFGGRKFDDSPRAIYEMMCGMPEFSDWKFVWAFVEPKQYDIPRGRKIKIDTPIFFKMLLSSKVWVSNSSMDRGFSICKKETISIDTWHGTPLKKICGEEHGTSMFSDRHLEKRKQKKLDDRTIRCAQSEYDREIFQRIFHASKDAILLSDLPRNDRLVSFDEKDQLDIREKIGVSHDKKIILYMPTYREYMTDSNNTVCFYSPIHVDEWKEKLGDEYVLLFRAHYAVSKLVNIKESNFFIDVSDYPIVDDLYIIADILVSDYSSAFFDFSILGRPMICYPYDLEEYEQKRGLYIDIENDFLCPVYKQERQVIEHIKSMNIVEECNRTQAFCEAYAPYAGHATEKVIEKLLQCLNEIEKY